MVDGGFWSEKDVDRSKNSTADSNPLFYKYPPCGKEGGGAGASASRSPDALLPSCVTPVEAAAIINSIIILCY